MNAQSEHQKRSRNTPGWLSQDYCAIVLVSSAIYRRRTPVTTPDESDNYSGGPLLKCVSPKENSKIHWGEQVKSVLLLKRKLLDNPDDRDFATLNL